MWRTPLIKRSQIVARIEPELRKAVTRLVKRQKTTLNAVVAAALRAYVDAVMPGAPTSPPKETR